MLGQKLLVGLFVLALSVSWVKAEGTDPRIEQAQRLFERYVALEHAFDPAIADLYSDNALIQTTREYWFGQKRIMVIPVEKYKWMMRRMTPLAKARGDKSRYSDVTYTLEGENVRIKCIRYSEMKKYFSPFELLVGPAEDGRWLIFEEISESPRLVP